MTKSKTNPQVDAFLSDAKTWRKELEQLRRILLGCQLTEELKWGQPCYTFQDHNVVVLMSFKDYCGLGFFQGALLRDPESILVKPGENTQAGRQIRFTHLREIVEMESTVKAYVDEAIEAEKAGLKVNLKKTSDFSVPDEFQSRLNDDPALKAAFDALTPGRQRAYLLHFSAPKQSKTRESRVGKSVPKILAGKGLTDP